MKRQVILSAVALVLSACAGSQQPAATPATQPPQTPTAAQPQKSALDPVGTFDFTTNVQGTDVAGSFEIVRKDDGSYGGRILTAAFPEIPITRVTVEASKLIVGGSVDGQALIMELTFSGDSFTGGWSVGDGSVGGQITGKRKA